MSGGKGEPYIRPTVTYYPEKGHALLSLVIYEGRHGYLESTCALTLDRMRTLRVELDTAIVAAEAGATT